MDGWFKWLVHIQESSSLTKCCIHKTIWNNTLNNLQREELWELQRHGCYGIVIAPLMKTCTHEAQCTCVIWLYSIHQLHHVGLIREWSISVIRQIWFNKQVVSCLPLYNIKYHEIYYYYHNFLIEIKINF